MWKNCAHLVRKTLLLVSSPQRNQVLRNAAVKTEQFNFVIATKSNFKVQRCARCNLDQWCFVIKLFRLSCEHLDEN